MSWIDWASCWLLAMLAGASLWGLLRWHERLRERRVHELEERIVALIREIDEAERQTWDDWR